MPLGRKVHGNVHAEQRQEEVLEGEQRKRGGQGEEGDGEEVLGVDQGGDGQHAQETPEVVDVGDQGESQEGLGREEEDQAVEEISSQGTFS